MCPMPIDKDVGGYGIEITSLQLKKMPSFNRLVYLYFTDDCSVYGYSKVSEHIFHCNMRSGLG